MRVDDELIRLPTPILERLERCGSIPRLPAAIGEMVALWRGSDDPEPTDVAAVIGRDAALGARVVGYANSAVIASPAAVTTIRQAIAVLGTRKVRNVAMAFTIMSLHRSAGDACRAVWRRAVMSSVLARELSSLEGWELDPDEMALAALVQDIGALALIVAIKKPYLELFARAGENHERLVDVERAELATDHAKVGAWMLARWGLPSVFVRIVESTHAVADADEKWRSAATFVASAGAISDVWVESAPRPRRRSRIGHDIDPIDRALARADRELSSAASSFRTRLKPVELHALAAEARSILGRVEKHDAK